MNELNYISSISDYKEIPNRKEVIETLHEKEINIFIPQKNISTIFDLYDKVKEEDTDLTKLLKQLIDFYNEFFE